MEFESNPESVILLSIDGGVPHSKEKLSVISPRADKSARQVFEALSREHLARLYAFALRLTGERAAAEDLVQETYVKAYQSFQQLVPGRGGCPFTRRCTVR